MNYCSQKGMGCEYANIGGYCMITGCVKYDTTIPFSTIETKNTKSQTELLTDVLHALFGPTLKGKYLVTIRGSKDFEADDRKDAIAKAKKYYSGHLDELNFDAIKIEDLLER